MNKNKKISGRYFFTADEHYFHKNIIKYSDRPYSCVRDMHEHLIGNHNKVVSANDTTIHAGDFSFGSKERTYKEVISKLNGNHVFLKGDHDKWLGNTGSYAWLRYIKGTPVYVSHYCMRTWWLSHYNSFNLFGHSHGKLSLDGLGKQMDVGVDANKYYPLSFDLIKGIMSDKPNNFNYINKKLRT